MENKHIFIALSGLAVLGLGILIGREINHPRQPYAYFCNNCVNIGDEFICHLCRKRPLDFAQFSQASHPVETAPQFRHHPDRFHERNKHQRPNFYPDNQRPAVKVLNNERPIDVRTGRPDDNIPPSALDKHKAKPFPSPKNHPPAPQVD